MLAIICVIGAIVLTAMSKSVPDQLWQIAAGAGIAGIGITSPGRSA